MEPILTLKELLWDELNSMQGPQCVLGDFNVILSAVDCKWGVAPNQVLCSKFLDCIHANNLLEMPYSGPTFTWSNESKGQNRIDKTLDRAFCNLECMDVWSSCKYQVLVKSCFDHTPILANL